MGRDQVLGDTPTGDDNATTGGGASTDRGKRDAGTPGPDPDEVASGPGTGASERYVDSDETDAGRARPSEDAGGPADKPGSAKGGA